MRRCDVVIVGFRPDAQQRPAEIVTRYLRVPPEAAETTAAALPLIAWQDVTLIEAETLEQLLYHAGAVVEFRMRRTEAGAESLRTHASGAQQLEASPVSEASPIDESTASEVRPRTHGFEPPAKESSAPMAADSGTAVWTREASELMHATPRKVPTEVGGGPYDLWLVSALPSVQNADRVVAELLGLDPGAAMKAVFEAPSMLKGGLTEAQAVHFIEALRAAGLDVSTRPALKSAPVARPSVVGQRHSNGAWTPPHGTPTGRPGSHVARPAAAAAAFREPPTTETMVPIVAAQQPRPAPRDKSAAKALDGEPQQAPSIQVRIAYLRLDGADVAVFDAHPKDGTDKDRAALLVELMAQARHAGMAVAKAALAYRDASGMRYFGTPDLVRHLVANGYGSWTHAMSFTRKA